MKEVSVVWVIINLCIVAREYLKIVLSEYINHQYSIKINSFNKFKPFKNSSLQCLGACVWLAKLQFGKDTYNVHILIAH